MSEFTKKASEQIDQILSNFPTREAALTPLFHLAHKECGEINNEIIEEISEIVNLSYNTVEQFFSQYRLFWPTR